MARHLNPTLDCVRSYRTDVALAVPQSGDRGIALKQQLEDKRIEHKRYINKCGQDLPEIRDWRWGVRRLADGGAT